MKNHCIAAFLTRKWFVFLLIICFNCQATARELAAAGSPPSSLLCISDCETCPVICSSPPATPKPLSPPPPPPPPVHHDRSPPQPYYFNFPAPPTPPPAPAARPPPPSYISWVGAIPPPSVYVYNPGSQLPPGMGQRNFSYPYYYFYTSKASMSRPIHEGFILFMFFICFYVC